MQAGVGWEGRVDTQGGRSALIYAPELSWAMRRLLRPGSARCWLSFPTSNIGTSWSPRASCVLWISVRPQGSGKGPRASEGAEASVHGSQAACVPASTLGAGDLQDTGFLSTSETKETISDFAHIPKT